MIEFTIRQIWDAVNNAYKTSVGTESLGLLTIIVALHLLLAVATLSLGGRTVCEMARPLRKIFKPDAQSVIEGSFEVFVAVPRAAIYYSGLYLRSYILALRILLWLWAATIVALFVPLAVSIVIVIIYGPSTPINDIGGVAYLVPLSFWPALAYFYWRFDGRRLAENFRAAWRC